MSFETVWRDIRRTNPVLYTAQNVRLPVVQLRRLAQKIYIEAQKDVGSQKSDAVSDIFGMFRT